MDPRALFADRSRRVVDNRRPIDRGGSNARSVRGSDSSSKSFSGVFFRGDLVVRDFGQFAEEALEIDCRWKRRLAASVETGDRDWNNGDSGEDPQSVMAAEQWRDSVWAVVARLPAEQRMALTLRFAEGMSYDEIGKAIDCASGAAKSRVHHGLRKLRETLRSDIRESVSIEGGSTSADKLGEFGNSSRGRLVETQLENQNACVRNGCRIRHGQDRLMPCPVDTTKLIARRS